MKVMGSNPDYLLKSFLLYPSNLRASSSAANHRSNMKTPNIYSEISSIAEDRSVKSQYVLNSVLSFEGDRKSAGGVSGSKPPSRMEGPPSRMEGAYFADWSELPKDDLDRWKEEKAKRMLAWIHTLHGNEHVGAETPWWKVRIHRLST